MEKSLQSAIGAFNDQHTAYLAAKSVFDKKNPEKSKASELKRLMALQDLNLQLIRLLRKLAELRLAFESNNLVSQKVKDPDAHLQQLSSAEDKNRALLNESQSLN